MGLDFAHGAGNLELHLHDDGPDFAVWCSYKYLNGGPGSLAGCFVHERHAKNPSLPRFEGWWGHNKTTRFQMGSKFDPIPGAEGWQLSNPPIFQLAALRASLELFDAATMSKLRQKSERLTGYLDFLLRRLPEGVCTIVTPAQPALRGAQLSLRLKGQPKKLLKQLTDAGVVCDFREPDIIRAAPAPLYCNHSDVYRFAKVLEEHARG
jgi:kynureninase